MGVELVEGGILGERGERGKTGKVKNKKRLAREEMAERGEGERGAFRALQGELRWSKESCREDRTHHGPAPVVYCTVYICTPNWRLYTANCLMYSVHLYT